MRWFVRLLPGAIIGVFGIIVFLWLTAIAFHPILLIPAIVGVLGIAYTIVPEHRMAKVGVGIAYVLGGLVAGFLTFGVLTAPMGGDPGETEAFVRVASPLVTLYLAGVALSAMIGVWLYASTTDAENTETQIDLEIE